MSIQLSYREVTVYLALWEEEYRFLADVARDTELSPVAVSRAVRALERTGVLTCERDKGRVDLKTIKLITPDELILKLPCARLIPYLGA